VALIGRQSGKVLEQALAHWIGQARELGEIGSSVEPKPAAQFIAASLTALKVAARGGATSTALRHIAAYALRSLSV
jgi:hypothetical protein